MSPGTLDHRIAACGFHALTRRSVSSSLPFVETYRDGDEWVPLADRTRRAIVERLAEGPLAVGELAAGLPVSRPAVSQHLKVLKDAGLVSEHAEGTRRIYRLNPIGMAALRDQLDTFWRRALTGYTDAVDEPTEENP
jgi:DNA-binding transcriptional ArsR family regulator